MNLKVVLLSFLLALPAISISSDSQTAHKLIDELTAEIHVAARASNEKNYKDKIQGVIDSKYKESIDFKRMTIIATGLADYRKAKKDQKSALLNEYTDFLMGTISSAIYEHSDHSIELLPSDGDEEGEVKTKVSLILKDPVSKQENEVDFMLHSMDGPWKIIDLRLFDTSTVEGHKADFEPILKEDGIDGLIGFLKKHNEKNK